MAYIFLIAGFIALIKGADYFVDGASGIAKYLKVPSILIGLTIVAFGTSSPEAAVSISAAIKGNNGIALGNVLGSNIYNISVIIGITALIFPLDVHKQTMRKEIPLTLLAGVALLILSGDGLLKDEQIMFIDRADGLILLLFFAVFVYYIVEAALNSKDPEENYLIDQAPEEGVRLKLNLLYTLGGLAAILIGGNWVVNSSIEIATSFGVSQTIIGLTIVAVGTSLPELITSVTAARKKNTDIAIGNIVGSNIFNVFFILGMSALISPIAVDSKLILELFMNIGLTLVLLAFSRSHSRIVKWEGIAFIMIYLGYMGVLVLNR